MTSRDVDKAIQMSSYAASTNLVVWMCRKSYVYKLSYLWKCGFSILAFCEIVFIQALHVHVAESP